ncbi:MAG: endo-1,4-beta-xylanase [Planctomycetaceae bacterium]
MGVMRFIVVPDGKTIDWPEYEAAYITQLDGRVAPLRVELQGNLLQCTRSNSDSGKLHIPWRVEGFGLPIITTTSLPESDRPYHLTLELARGKIAETREQAYLWETAGMLIPDNFRSQIKLAYQLFSKASANRNHPTLVDDYSQQALTQAFRAADVLGGSYAIQRFKSRMQSLSHRPALLGCTVDESLSVEVLKDLFCSTFSAAVVPVEWNRIEPTEGNYNWQSLDDLVSCCQQQRMFVRGGPLIDLSAGGLPQWLTTWKDDFLNLQSFVCDFIETAVSHYAGQIRMWEVVARPNTGGGLRLTEEQRLALTARSLEAAQRTDTEAQLFIRIDRPWGDYQAGGQHRLTPIQFVDALVRSSLGLSGVNLEIAVGYHPQGSRHRDLLAVSRLIDVWSLLGIQLHVTLSFPSSATKDSQAVQEVAVGRSECGVDWSEEVQSHWASRYVTLLMSKPAVTGVFWTHFSDGFPHRFPNAGIIRPDGSQKPVVKVLRSHGRKSSQDLPANPDGTVGEGTWISE